MTFHPVRNKRKKVALWVTTCGILLFTFLVFTPLPYPFGFIREVMRPVLQLRSNIYETIARGWGVISLRQQTIDELLRLRRENAQLRAQAVSTQADLIDNLLFNSDTNVTEERQYQAVKAGVLLVPPRLPYDIFLLDRGSRDQVAVGDDVYFRGIYMGQISDVGPRTSQVLLFSTSGEDVELLVGKEAVRVTARGRGAGNFEVRIPRDVPIEVGDVALSPTSKRPPVAVVGSIDSSPQEPFKTVYLEFPFNLFQVAEVEIVRSK